MIGEVSPEVAHEIGKQFADEILKGKYEYVLATHIDKRHCHNHIIFNSVDYVDHHAYKSYRKIYYEMREVSDRLCKEHGLSVIPPSQGKGMDYKEYTETKRSTSWKQKLKQTIDRCVITAKDYDEFLKLMQDAGYEIKTGKYIAFRAEGQERFTRAKTIGENYTEERIKERIQGRNPRKRQIQTNRNYISLMCCLFSPVYIKRQQAQKIAELLLIGQNFGYVNITIWTFLYKGAALYKNGTRLLHHVLFNFFPRL